MKDQKSLLLGIAIAISTFAIFAFGAPSTAFAQIGGGQCSSDSQCFQTMICEYGECIEGCRNDFGCPSGLVCDTTSNLCVQPNVCDAGANNLSNFNKTIAILPASSYVYVGMKVAFSGVSSYRNIAANASCAYQSGCGTSYRSYMKYTTATCGGGEGCFAEDSTTKSPSSSYISVNHSHLVYPTGGSGKYTITEIKGTCNSSGSKIVVLTRCNC